MVIPNDLRLEKFPPQLPLAAMRAHAVRKFVRTAKTIPDGLRTEYGNYWAALRTVMRAAQQTDNDPVKRYILSGVSRPSSEAAPRRVCVALAHIVFDREAIDIHGERVRGNVLDLWHDDQSETLRTSPSLAAIVLRQALDDNTRRQNPTQYIFIPYIRITDGLPGAVMRDVRNGRTDAGPFDPRVAATRLESGRQFANGIKAEDCMMGGQVSRSLVIPQDIAERLASVTK